MPQILFSLAEPRVLVLGILCCSITFYFLTLVEKTLDLRFLIGAFSCWTLHFALAVCGEAIYPLSQWFLLAQMCVGLVGLVLFVGFAYHFRGNPHPREFRVGLTFASIIVGVCCSFLIFQIVANASCVWCVGSGASLLLFAWAEAVLVRRWVRATSSQTARPYRDFALVFLLSLAAVGVYFLRDIGAFPAEMASVLSSLLFLSTLVGFTLVYVNNAPRPTSFRVKIVGASLFTVLAVLTVIWTATAPDLTNSTLPAKHIASRAALTTAASIKNPEFAARLAAQKTVVRCNYCIVGSALFVLIFFPAFFRSSLVDPLNALLEAVDRVDAGSRDVDLPVSFNDEIGRLTSNFNRMTRSLRAAEDDLRCYAESLELKVQERTAELGRKNEENERLLLNIFPASIAERLKRGEGLIADACPEVTILFADIVGFTALSSRVPACDLVELLSGLISDFDELAQKHGVEKIKTIGDSYMAVAGLPHARADHADAAVRLGLDMLSAVEKRKTHDGKSLHLRIGINSGPVVAGVIGTHKHAYDLWGDTVNTASRMESHGTPDRIQVTEETYNLLRHQYQFESRGVVDIKGKGAMPTYFVGNAVKDAMPACEKFRWAVA